MKKKIFDITLFFLLLFPLTTLFQDKINAINKIIFALCFVCMLIFMICKGTVKKKNLNIILWLAFFVNCLWVLSIGVASSINMMLYLPFLFIYTIFVIDSSEAIIKFLREKKEIVSGVVITWIVLVVISIPLASSYVEEWGEGLYFVSYTSSAFRLCPTALFIMTLVVWMTVDTGKKRYLLYDIVPMFCMFMGGSRTYLGIGILIFLINWYLILKKKKYFYYSFIPILLLFIIVLQYTAMQSKIDATTYTSESYFDFWGTVTNGRSLFWVSMLNAFFDSNFISKLLGCGFDFTVGVEGIWAHNDFIEILCTYGYVGVVIYLYTIIKQMKVLLSRSRSKIPLVLIGMVVLAWGINAFFNMFYTYFCAVASFPFLLLSISEYYKKKSYEEVAYET